MPNVHLVVIGNKSDAEDTREVASKEVEEYCQKKGIKHVEASAKNGDHVTEAFESISEVLTTIFPKNEK